MKKEINAAMSGIAKVDEIILFKEMANQFNNNMTAKCTYVKEVHKMMVEFYSSFKGGTETKEIGDLLLLTFDKSKNELRLCVLQAKYRKGVYRNFLNCRADAYQWELLYYKPDVYNKSTIGIPKHILNFRNDYKSITAYGVFYHDKYSNKIDFLYTLPESFAPKRLMPKPSSTFMFNCPNLSFGMPSCCGCSKTVCPTKQGGVPKETLFTCSMDIFEQEVLRCKVGAPIDDDEIRKYILKLLDEMKRDAEDPEIIDEILRDYEYEYYARSDYYKFEEGHPAAIIVITDSEKS